MSNKPERKSTVSRRKFTKNVLGASAAIGLGMFEALGAEIKFTETTETYDYVIVGSGVGGGPLAANLAKAGFRVLVLEAGDSDPSDEKYKTPAWHALASEQDTIGWEFYVKHYSGDRDKQDSKYVKDKGIFYPRGSTIGGSTANNALITVYPHNNDFDYIASLTGDDSWDSRQMRKYFERLENCGYLSSWQARNEQHGTNGWLPTNYPDTAAILDDLSLLNVIKGTFKQTDRSFWDLLFNKKSLDVNKLAVAAGEEGSYMTALAMNNSARRTGVREHLLATQQQYPNNLFIRTNALASRILFQEQTAIGVEYYEGKNLYKADRLYSGSAGVKKQVKASREVILSGGAFNSPQLLKLSGVGPAAELTQHGIPVVADSPHVGTNLQDRYEVGVVTELNQDIIESCTFGDGYDPCLTRYNLFGAGPYTSNGVISSWIKRSSANLPDPDLFMFALTGYFKGYYPGYSDDIINNKNKLTWAILKGHTENTSGQVALRSANPTDTPQINFKYFDDGNDLRGNDMKAMVEGVKSVRSLMATSPANKIAKQEALPGASVNSDEQIADFVQKEAWGHHASCTNKIGLPGESVIDSKFRVHGVQNLRVVDASVFPKIPGFFIAVPIYMISEKATDDILATAGVNAERLHRRTKSPAINADTHAAFEASIYPNPTANRLNIVVSNAGKQADEVKVFILSGAGETVLTATEKLNSSKETISLDVSALKPGSYVYHVATPNAKKSGHFMVVR